MASGPLDELVGLHERPKIFEALDAVPTDRHRAGIEDRLLAALPFVEQGSLCRATGQRFAEPAVLSASWLEFLVNRDGVTRYLLGNDPTPFFPSSNLPHILNASPRRSLLTLQIRPEPP